MNFPHQQQFDRKKANEKKGQYNEPKNLSRRITDFNNMMGQRTIGNGHRDQNGYTCPGSNKK